MRGTSTDRIVEDYLRRLEASLKDLPRDRRQELVEEIREHIEVGRSELGSESEADLRSLLDRIGDPADIAADSTERLGIQPDRVGLMEVAAVVLLPIGGVVVPFLGWVVGVILLWASKAWTLRDKLIGTFLLPGGLLLPAYLLLTVSSSEVCSSGPGVAGGSSGPGATTCVQSGPGAWAVAAMVLLIVVPIASAAYLAVRLHRHRASG
jgi:uncharacterized membrane protein